MKNILKQLMICSIGLFALSCIKADLPQGAVSSDEGVLAISPVSVVADVVEKGKPATRAEEVDPADFMITITRVNTSDVVHTGKYSEFPAEGLPLVIGDYNFYIENKPVSNSAWEEIHYSASRNFSISKEATTTLNDIVCKVTNILVSVKFTDRMKDLMDTDGKVSVELVRNNPRVWNKAETRTAGYKAEAEANTLTWDFEGYIGEFYVEQTDIITGVKAGEHRTLTFDIVPPEEGQVEFGFSVSVECTVVNLNENVEVEEPIIKPLPEPVVIELSEGLVFDTPMVLYLGANNLGNREPLPAGMTMTLKVPNGINVLNLKVSSSNTTNCGTLFNTSTGPNGGIANGIDLFADPIGIARNYVNNYMGITTGEQLRGTTEYVLDITNMIGNYYQTRMISGSSPAMSTWDITLTGGDAKGNILTKQVRFELKKENKPVSDFKLDITGDGIAAPKVLSAQNILDGATVSVLIEASAGIKGLSVSMSSTNGDFDGVVRGLSPLDLSVETSPILEQLAGLGVSLPHGSDVVGKTSVTFDISEFLSLMTNFLYAGDFTSNFELTVTDNEDRVITKTIVLTITE